MTRQNEKNHYKNYFTTNKDNLQKVWKGIKEIINIKSKSNSQPNCIIDKGKTITEPSKIANSFNNYFTSVADNILKKRKYEGKDHFSKYLSKPNPFSIALYDCDQEEIENTISTFNPHKAVGPNSIPSDILHLLKSTISYPLMVIFNLSLSTGVHPEALKTAKAIPVHKKGSKLDTGNYRPISLLSNINKILEKQKVWCHLQNYKDVFSKAGKIGH